MILKLILTRVGTAALTLLAVSAVIFATVEVLPGDVAVRVLGQMSSPEQRRVFRDRLHLDVPAPIRYVEWLERAVHGDFGRSFVNQRDVASVIMPRLRITLLLSIYAFTLYLPVTIVFAVLGAVFHGQTIDLLVSTATLLAFSLPEFVFGTLLIVIFVLHVPWFPAMSLIDQAKNPIEFLWIAALPAITLTVRMAAYPIRMLRDNLIEVLDSEYVRMAVLNGLPAQKILLRHILPNALGPALNITALNMAYVIGGAVVVENLFAIPGIGSLLVDSISLRDVPVVEAAILLVSLVYILGNLVADLGAVLSNPRIGAL